MKNREAELISQNFCEKIVRVNFRNFHTVCRLGKIIVHDSRHLQQEKKKQFFRENVVNRFDKYFFLL